MAMFEGAIPPETYALIRFGYGFPAKGAPVAAGAILERLAGPDTVGARFPKPGRARILTELRAYDTAAVLSRSDPEGMKARTRTAFFAMRDSVRQALAADLARIAETDDPFRERLVQFWTNHFSTRAPAATLLNFNTLMRDEAIRPRVAGRFEDLLIAAVTHPMMLIYLDQVISHGPNSIRGLSRRDGLNENLAREVLELHTLGVGAGYTQTDVRELAELLTGLVFNFRTDDRVRFLQNWVEPGPETVLGRSYGGSGPGYLADIHTALRDLAVHPATARHVSGKLAAHFVADTPDPGLVDAMSAAWRDTGGDLPRVYATMLTHPAAWRKFGAKVKPPLAFIASALRALGVSGQSLVALSPDEVARRYDQPLKEMDQDYEGALGPDGFPDRAENWVQPYSLAHRIGWAMAAAARDDPVDRRDPVDFARETLGAAAGADLIWAAGAAETRATGVGLVLASPEFNRR